jgi:hypothetical protein
MHDTAWWQTAVVESQNVILGGKKSGRKIKGGTQSEKEINIEVSAKALR